MKRRRFLSGLGAAIAGVMVGKSVEGFGTPVGIGGGSDGGDPEKGAIAKLRKQGAEI